MAVELKRSQVPSERVSKAIDNRYKAFKDLSGRNPTEGERKKMKDQIVGIAKKLDRDGRA